MSSTLYDQIIQRLTDTKEEKDRTHAVCPSCGKKPGKGGDVHFSIYPSGKGHGYNCFVCGFSSKDEDADGDTGMKKLAKMLNIEIKPVVAANTKRDYEGLDDYAEDHGVNGGVFRDAGWSDKETYQNRPALRFKTASGDRVRFIDGEKPKVKPTKKGYKACWYGLERAKTMDQGILVLCNGEPSTVVAQHYGIPAITISAGEGSKLKYLKDGLVNDLRRYTVYVVFDCDAAGRKATHEVTLYLRQQAIKAVPLDLNGGDKFDLADFCKLHREESSKALLSCDVNKDVEEAVNDFFQKMHEESFKRFVEEEKERERRRKPDPDAPSYSYRHYKEWDDLNLRAYVADIMRDDWLYCETQKRWHHWNLTHWGRCDFSDVMNAMIPIVASLQEQVSALPSDGEEELKARERYLSFIGTLTSLGRRKSLVEDVSAVLNVSPQAFNKATDILPVQNGYIDLRTGDLYDHDKSFFYTYSIPIEYDTDATADEWLNFLAQVQPTREVQDFLQIYAGYCLSGRCEDKAILLYGSGANGKSVFANTIAGLLDEYAVQIDSSALIVGRSTNKNYDLANLEGARLCQVQELPGGTLRAETFKIVVDNGRLGIERKYEQPYQIDRTHAIIMHANNLPKITDRTNGTWRRLALVPFDTTIPAEQRISDYDQVLLSSEASGILLWAVTGAIRYYSDGLQIPESVKVATEGYRSQEDNIQDFINDVCVVANGAYVPVKLLYEIYSDFVESPVSIRDFASELRKKGFEKGTRQISKKATKCWVGIGLSAASDDDDPDVGTTETDSTTTETDSSKPSVSMATPSTTGQKPFIETAETDETDGFTNFSYSYTRDKKFTETAVSSVSAVTESDSNTVPDDVTAETASVTPSVSSVSEQRLQREADERVKRDQLTALRARITALPPFRDMNFEERIETGMYETDVTIEALKDLLEIGEASIDTFEAR